MGLCPSRLRPGPRVPPREDVDALLKKDEPAESPPTSPKTRPDMSLSSPCAILTDFWLRRLHQDGTHIPQGPGSIIKIVSVDGPRFPQKDDHEPWFGPMKTECFGERWSIDAFLGAGAFGQTYLATHEHTGHRYVLKYTSDPDDREVQFLQSAPLKLFQHPNVVTYCGIATDLEEAWRPATSIIALEAIPNGEVFDLITASENALSDGTVRRLAVDIINGAAELCKCGITHRDLKPDNLLLDENGHAVIIDLGCAKVVYGQQAEESPASGKSPKSTTSTNSAAASSAKSTSRFLRTQTRDVGTDMYQAPESEQEIYDSEKADVFTIGILVFLLKQPKSPFSPEFGGLEVVTDLGADEEWWSQEAFPHFADPAESSEIKAFINCLWALDPEKRPTFEDLQAAISGDADSLARFPALTWLSKDFSLPMDFVRELRERRPDLSLKCTGVVEALAHFVQGFGDLDAAFGAANASGSGSLTAIELTTCLQQDNANRGITPEGVADLMLRYMAKTSQGMSLDQFKVMAKAWDFGERPFEFNLSRYNSRLFAFARGKQVSEKEEFERFTSVVTTSLAYAGHRVRKANNAFDAETFKNAAVYTVTMRRELCQLRLSTFTVEDNLVVQSRRVWGSCVEELMMLQKMNSEVEKEFGARVPTPASLST